MVWRRYVGKAVRFAYRHRRTIRRVARAAAARRSRRLRTVGRGSSRVYVPRHIRRAYRSRAVRSLARNVNRIRNVIDVDTTFKDSSYEAHQFQNQNGTPVAGGPAIPVTALYAVDLNKEMAENLQAGNRYRLKSLNERFTLSMSTINDQADAAKGVRHVRIMYFLFRDEKLQTYANGDPDFSPIFDIPSTGYTTKPALAQNQGYTYRILYDRTFSVSSLSTKEVMVRLPARLFYNGGQVKFSPATGD